MKTLKKMLKQIRTPQDTNLAFSKELLQNVIKLEEQIQLNVNANEIFVTVGNILYNLTQITNSYNINHYNALLSKINQLNSEYYSNIS